MRKFSFIERLIAVCCILAIMLSFPWTPVLAAAETDVRVTASTNASVKQGNSAYTYVSIDSMESLSTLEVTVHYDPAVVQLTGSYNQVDALVYDSGSTESTLQYTYIFDGNGQNAKTQLFYFEYIVKKDAPVGQTYFDIVVGDAFDAAFNTLPISGSRCSFRVAEAVTNLQCSIRGTSSVETAVNQEFTLTYRFSTTEIASGSVAIRFDPELFAVSEVIQGGFLTDKMTDINTTLSGAVYLSFLGAQYGSSDQLLSLRMKTLKNTAQLSPITVTVTDLYNLQLDPITCGGYTTPVRVTYDPTVDENAPYVFLEQTYDPEAQTVTVQVCLEENAHLGAGDFVLQFDTERLAYKSAVKGYNSTFFTINDKNTDEGLLKFSVISLTDITTAEILLTATFDVLTPCESTATKLQISGSGLANHLTDPIVLNFTGCTVETAGHTAVVDAAVAPTCLETGLTEGSHCSVCEKVLVAQTVIDALGHDEIPHEAVAPTCTQIGWEAYVTCSRCDYTTYQEIPATGHTFQKGVCVICGAAQDPGKTWDVSAAADGSLMAKLYLNADGTYDLQLTGSGPMKNWSGQSSMPWYSYREKITGLRLPDGLTTIGDYAFNSFPLTEITLPESLESLGYMAFYQCTKLQQINFNAVAMNDMTEGNHVFSYCGQETDGITLRIGADVEKIPAYLFLPDTRSSYKPKLKAVEFEAGGNCLEIGRMAFYQCRDISRLQLPEGLQSIGYYAFAYCAGLESLTLPEGLMTIENYAFYACDALQEVELPGSLQSIGAAVFYSCDALRKVTVNEGVTAIAERAFYGCTSLSSLQLPEGLQTIGSSAFQDCSGLSELQLQKGLVTIGEYAFYGCTGLTELTLPESLQTIGNYAFYNCKSLTRINYNAISLADLSNNNRIFSYAGHSGDGITVTVGSSVTKIPAYLFYLNSKSGDAPKIVAVEFAEGSNCQSIGSYAFYNCNGLTELTLPESLQTIEDYAFYGCTGLNSLHLPEGLQTIDYWVFGGCTGLETLSLPESLQTIGSNAFQGCTGLESLNLPESLQTIGSYAFFNCTSLTKISYNAISLADLSEYNYVFSYAGQGGDGITVTVGGSVTKIPAYLFNPYYNSDYAPKIVAVEFAGGSNCQSIGSYAFSYCKTLKTLILPESLQTIGGSAFYGCTGLEYLDLPESLQTIGSSAFYGCTGLESLNLPESLQTIGSYAFFNCTSLTKINYNAISLADLSEYNYVFSYAGRNGDGITVIVGNSVTTIPDYLFACDAPKIVVVEFAEGSNCQSIGSYAFYLCTGLRKVVVMSSAVAEALTSNSAAGYLTQYAQTVLLPGDTTINSYLQNKYANREQIIRDGVSYWLLDQNTHSWLETQTLIERIPCQRDGLIRYTCEYCEIYRDVTVERHTIVGHEAKAPDCVHIGWHAYETCENCDYSTYTELPALGHDPVAHDARAQTCLAIGWEAYETCSRCDYSTYQELPALGHDEIPHAAQAVTCLEIGWDAYVTCSRCDYSTYQEIPALGHGIIKHDALAPTCLEIGWDAYETCSRCDYSTYAELSALGHRVLQRTTSGLAPYEEKNDATWPFSREGDVFASSNHDDSTTSNYVITAKRDHTLTVECKVSSEKNYDFLWVYHNGSVIAALAGEADWQAYTLELKAGDTVKITYQKDGSQSKGQDTGWFRLKASWLEQLPAEEADPTCVEPVVCAFCEIKLKDALGHDPVYSHTQQPTCLEVGYHVYACTRCAYTEKQEIAALGHDPVYSHTQQPTCLEVGYHVYACTRCDYIEKQEIAALGHDLVSHEAKAPACTEIGWDAYEACGRCSYTTYKEIPATGHSFVETFCTGCGMKQTPMQSWDVSAAGDGSLMAYLYQNLVDGGCELELEGSGTMKDYSYNAPWYSTGYCYSINRVSLPEGLTYIGACAFQYCSNLRQIRIPDSVERIGDYVFDYSKNLVIVFEGDDASLAPSYGWYGSGYYFDPQKVILEADATYVIDKDGNAVLAKYVGNGNEFVAREEIDGIPVTQIGRYAFYQKTKLKTYWISEEINTIGDYAFGECNGTALLLESTQLPASLGSGWNGSCNYYPGAQLFTENDFLFVKDQNDRVNLITYQGAESEITVPAQPGGYSITQIPNYAFYENRMLTRVVLPEGIVSVGDSAFAGCSCLQEVVLPTSLEKIGSSAFQYCGALQSIWLPEELQTIGTGAFWGCSSLTEISVPDSVTRLESTTFTDCSRLESVTLPKNLNYMGYMQFYGCPNLKELELPEGVHSIESNSFYNCRSLKVVYVRSARLAAQLTGSGDAHEMIQNATTVVVPTDSGTDYLKETYPYCETRERKGMAVDVYSSCAHNWQTEKVSEYAQCVSDGYEVHTCSLCGVWTDDRIPMHAMETTRFAPTCTEEGYTLHTCADCDVTERTDPVNKLGHERDYGGVLCNRCGEVACLLAVKNGDSLFGCDSWSEAMNQLWQGNTLVLYGDITEDVVLYQTMYLDLNGHSIYGTLTVSEGATLYGVDSATDDFTGSYGTIAAVNGNYLTDATSVDGKRYIALTDEKGVSFHRLRLQLHTVSLRTADAGLYYKASVECDETLRNAITRHGVALSLERMPGTDFQAEGSYTWMEGAPTGDFTSGSVVNIFRSDLSAAENAARGGMKIYANAYLQLADGTILMSDATTGDTVDSYRFDGVAWSMQDVLEVLNRDIDTPAYAEHRQQILAFCEAWKDVLSGWQLTNLTQ